MSDTTARPPRPRRQHTAGAFDIRNIIGALLGIYGVILTLHGPLRRHQELDKTGGVNANLWAGIVLLVVGAVFIVWARLKPIVVPDARRARRRRPDPPGAEASPAGH